jgi:ribosomal peptide maturation radical SAM protein 1
LGAQVDVAFVVVPFADVERPAIGVSLLSAELQQAGFSSCVEYVNFDLAADIGLQLYTRISESLPTESLVGEWLFAHLVSAEEELPSDEQYTGQILSKFASPALIAEIRAARRVTRGFVERCAQRLLDINPRVVGFSTTFHQTCCCLAVARLLKEHSRPPIVAFGGANCEGAMGQQLIRSFPWIDYVCTREGDIAFPALVNQLLRGDEGHQIPGVPGDRRRQIPGILSRENCNVLTTPDLVRNLDDLPTPDYRDYFERLRASEGVLQVKPELLIETSRGCWWGAKHHCTFCGLNGDTMHFRSKSAKRAFAELRTLVQEYGVFKVDCVDNILDLKYLDTLFPMLAEAALGVELFYEVKANLRQSQVKRLHAGGVRSVQPGIESFSNEVLRIMRKGCTGLQNIQLLRWCAEESIAVAWNILAGFPGEPISEYTRMEKLIPLLTHLQPPSSCSPIRLDRFSPLFTRAAELGIARIRPNPAYYYVFPFGSRELAQLAYFFDFDYPDGREPGRYLQGVRREVDNWIVAYSDSTSPPRLDAIGGSPDELTILDTRRCAVRAEHRLQGVHAYVYGSCDTARTRETLAAESVPRFNRRCIDRAIDELLSDNLMVEMEGRYLSLAVFRNRDVALDGQQRAVPHIEQLAVGAR